MAIKQASTSAETGIKIKLHFDFFKWVKKQPKSPSLFARGKSVFANLTENLNASVANKIVQRSEMNIPGNIISI